MLAVLSAIIPGIGPVMAGGLGALSLVGAVGGVLAGAAAGSALEHAMADGLPKDELFLYADALRQGRTVLMVLTEDGGCFKNKLAPYQGATGRDR